MDILHIADELISFSSLGAPPAMFPENDTLFAPIYL